MGSCLSCPEKESIPDNHQSKFKVINVDDDGNELGSGVMELTDAELVLHTHRRDDVRWPYLCLRRYGYDSNLFSFESGRRCQTGQGIFAFKCARAEEIFNMLQEVMHSHSISVVEEAVLEPSHQAALTPAALGYSVPSVPNGVTRIPSVGEAPSHPSSRHPSVASTRLPSVGEESTHPLLVADEAVHTYVNTTGLLEEQPSPLTVTTPLESPTSPQSQCPPTPPPPPRVRGEPPPPTPTPAEPQVLLEPQGVRFVLGPTPVQRQLMERRQKALKDAAEHQETNGHGEKPTEPEPAATHSNGSSAPRRHRPPPSHPTCRMSITRPSGARPCWTMRTCQRFRPCGRRGSRAPRTRRRAAAAPKRRRSMATTTMPTTTCTTPTPTRCPLRSSPRTTTSTQRTSRRRSAPIGLTRPAAALMGPPSSTLTSAGRWCRATASRPRRSTTSRWRWTAGPGTKAPPTGAIPTHRAPPPRRCPPPPPPAAPNSMPSSTSSAPLPCPTYRRRGRGTTARHARRDTTARSCPPKARRDTPPSPVFTLGSTPSRTRTP
uniref:Fibroblast growth factor receptor substrate 2b n=2 Tax=Maylandia zebra TaxID=106582 RepID=A0A3P9CYJ3_9CICH